MKRFAWAFNRIRVMTLHEILYRCWRMLMQVTERFFVIAGWQPSPALMVAPRLSLFGEDSSLIQQWQQVFKLDTDILDSYRNGTINFFGHKPLDVGNPVDWHRDPMTGVQAPLVFGKSINYRDDRIVGNVKFTWELGRHQHLVPLVLAYVATGDRAYRQVAVRQIESWIEDNPYAMGIHWSSALEVALRLIAWAVIHSLLVLRDGSQGLFEAAQNPERLGKSIYQQAFFVRHFLSQHSSANNHLIGELSGLWVVCQVFDLGEKGECWASLTHEMLERESSLQVYSDGVNKEQAFYYHLWVIDYLVFVWLVSTRCSEGFSQEFSQRILAMAAFLEDVSPTGGEPPQVGDADDGFVARFTPNWPAHPYRELLDTVQAVFNNTGTKKSEKAFWYKAMLEPSYQTIPVQEWKRVYPAIYQQGGYAVLGDKTHHLLLDAGPLGYLGIAAHGHADALSVCLALDGYWWLIDPGTYAYHSSPVWRNYFRGTSAHNTVRVNSQDQSRIGGPFLWLEKAVSVIEESSRSEKYQYVKATHDGYISIGFRHTRELRYTMENGAVEITDTVDGTGDGVAELFFHFAPDIQVKRAAAENCWIATRQNCDKELEFYTDRNWEFGIFCASKNPILGWYSPALEEKVPTVTLRGITELSTTRRSVTQIKLKHHQDQCDSGERTKTEAAEKGML